MPDSTFTIGRSETVQLDLLWPHVLADGKRYPLANDKTAHLAGLLPSASRA
jgi:hypothetical protein